MSLSSMSQLSYGLVHVGDADGFVGSSSPGILVRQVSAAAVRSMCDSQCDSCVRGASDGAAPETALAALATPCDRL